MPDGVVGLALRFGPWGVIELVLTRMSWVSAERGVIVMADCTTGLEGTARFAIASERLSTDGTLTDLSGVVEWAILLDQTRQHTRS